MTATRPQEVLEREVRLGIVLYGGVSLAIYENGVAQELFRAVKGEGVYSLIKQLIDSDLVVDILSGTSAGGINGVMLGYALANGRDCKSTSKLWREDGDILRLMRNPGRHADSTSLLDSRGYYQERLKAAFDTMPAYVPPCDGVASDLRLVSETKEFDLFVTGTDVQGHTFTAFDEQGHPVDVKDHHRVFQLSYRQNRKNEFEPADTASLAKLCRITSCFPVAFEPVEVNPGDPRDEALKRWGKLDDRKSVYFLDGGVLNNKPFSYTIDAITRRTADRDVDRMLLYVEPDPERFEDEAPISAPNIMQAGAEALIGIPGYQSIASDLQSIAAHNDKVQLYEDLMRCAPSVDQAPDCFEDPDRNEFESISDASCRRMYTAARLGQLRDRTIDGILKTGGNRRLLRKQERHAAKILVESFENWKDAPAEDTLHRFDVYYRKRRLLHLSYYIKELIFPRRKGSPRGASLDAYRLLWSKINHQFKLLEEIEFAMESAIDLASIPWADLRDKDASTENAMKKWEMAQNVMVAVLDTAGTAIGGALTDGAAGDQDAERLERETLMAVLRERVRAASNAPPIAARAPVGNLLERCDRIEREILRKFAPGKANDPVCREYCRFTAIDAFLFPMQRMAGMESVDVIRTVRISPIDAQRAFSNLSLDAKLCGNELGHFGGFLKRSWRANDTMWGRLDAVCQLIECLVTPERMKQVRPEKVHKALRHDLPALFPNSPALWEEIRRLAGELQMEDGETKSRFTRFWDALVSAAQAEILHEEVPRVIKAAIGQQSAWNQFVLQKPKRPLLSAKQVWSVSPRRLDSAMAGYAAAMLTQDIRPQGGWPLYFTNTYSVGSENWNSDIPKPILVEMMAHAALVLENCLLAAAGPHAAKLRTSLVYKVCVNWPLAATYHFVRLQRTAPEYVWVTAATALAVSVATLVFDLVFRADLFGGHPGWQRWLWIIVPTVVILLIGGLLYSFRGSSREPG